MTAPAEVGMENVVREVGGRDRKRSRVLIQSLAASESTDQMPPRRRVGCLGSLAQCVSKLILMTSSPSRLLDPDDPAPALASWQVMGEIPG